MADKSSVLLIGTNISGKKIRECAAVSRRSKVTKISHLDGVLKDLSQMNAFMNDRHIPVFDVILGQHQTKQNKEDLMNMIERFFKRENVRRFVITIQDMGVMVPLVQRLVIGASRKMMQMKITSDWMIS